MIKELLKKLFGKYQEVKKNYVEKLDDQVSDFLGVETSAPPTETSEEKKPKKTQTKKKSTTKKKTTKKKNDN